MADVEVKNNEAEGRFEVALDGQLALLEYRRSGGMLVLVHTEVPEQFEGRGIGGKLAKTALEFARQEGMKVVPRCPFVAVYLKRHPEYQDLVASGG